jgi:hypothetical protein
MGSFWRAKFREKFALCAGTSNMELQTTYQRRMKQLRRGTGYSFFRGNRQREIDVVNVLRELIIGKCCHTSYNAGVLLDATCANVYRDCSVKYEYPLTL